MSGTRASWTPERRAAQARRMRKRYRNPEERRRQGDRVAKRMQDPALRAASSARMKRLNARIRDDEKLKAKMVRGQKRVRRAPGYRLMQSLVMAEVMSRPELRRRARAHCIKINKDPKIRKRQWASRRKKAASIPRPAPRPGARPALSASTAAPQ